MAAEVAAGKESDRKNLLGQAVVLRGRKDGQDVASESACHVQEVTPGRCGASLRSLGSWAAVAGVQAQDSGMPYGRTGSGPVPSVGPSAAQRQKSPSRVCTYL